jgi:hypothetical protein
MRELTDIEIGTVSGGRRISVRIRDVNVITVVQKARNSQSASRGGEIEDSPQNISQSINITAST